MPQRYTPSPQDLLLAVQVLPVLFLFLLPELPLRIYLLPFPSPVHSPVLRIPVRFLQVQTILLRQLLFLRLPLPLRILLNAPHQSLPAPVLLPIPHRQLPFLPVLKAPVLRLWIQLLPSPLSQVLLPQVPLRSVPRLSHWNPCRHALQFPHRPLVLLLLLPPVLPKLLPTLLQLTPAVSAVRRILPLLSP